MNRPPRWSILVILDPAPCMFSLHILCAHDDAIPAPVILAADVHCDRAARAESRARTAAEGWEEDKELWEADRSVHLFAKRCKSVSMSWIDYRWQAGQGWNTLRHMLLSFS
jgi:hypothetical protein